MIDHVDRPTFHAARTLGITCPLCDASVEWPGGSSNTSGIAGITGYCIACGFIQSMRAWFTQNNVSFADAIKTPLHRVRWCPCNGPFVLTESLYKCAGCRITVSKEGLSDLPHGVAGAKLESC